MGFALFGSSSESASYKSTTTQTWNDSGNTAFSSARTYENVGNPVLNLGLPDAGGGGVENAVTLAFAGLLLVGGLVMLNRSS